MDLHNLQHHLDQRLDKLENKLDNHLERISKAEASVDHLKGHAKVVITVLLSALSGLAVVVWELIKGKLL